jgi:hypothetical protein
MKQLTPMHKKSTCQHYSLMLSHYTAIVPERKLDTVRWAPPGIIA